MRSRPASARSHRRCSPSAAAARLPPPRSWARPAGIERFHSAAYARHNGTAPLRVSSASPDRHRLSRTGNRQLNAALHRIAVTQANWHPPAQAMTARRKAAGDTPREARHVLKRRLSDVVYRALNTDTAQPAT